MSSPLSQIQYILEQRKSTNPATFYTAQLFHKDEENH